MVTLLDHLYVDLMLSFSITGLVFFGNLTYGQLFAPIKQTYLVHALAILAHILTIYFCSQFVVFLIGRYLSIYQSIIINNFMPEDQVAMRQVRLFLGIFSILSGIFDTYLYPRDYQTAFFNQILLLGHSSEKLVLGPITLTLFGTLLVIMVGLQTKIEFTNGALREGVMRYLVCLLLVIFSAHVIIIKSAPSISKVVKSSLVKLWFSKSPPYLSFSTMKGSECMQAKYFDQQEKYMNVKFELIMYNIKTE